MTKKNAEAYKSINLQFQKFMQLPFSQKNSLPSTTIGLSQQSKTKIYNVTACWDQLYCTCYVD